MNSIDRMIFEIKSQRRILPSLRFPKPRNPERCIFIGSGDSYVSCLLSSYLSGLKSPCFTPSEIITFPTIARGYEVFFVSISGKTSANIHAANVMNSHNIKTTAVTTDYNSTLAKTCKNLIWIDIPLSTQPTSGTLTFTASTLTCMRLVTDKAKTSLIPSIFSKCEKILRDNKDYSFNNCLYVFLANNFLYPCAVYGKLKINEIFGYPSSAYSIDEFFHAPIFSLRDHDCIILLENGENKQNASEKKIYNMLSNARLKILPIRTIRGTLFEKVMSSIFTQQMIFATQAQKLGLHDCVFIKNKKFLSLSSGVIYHA
ncbi:MAG TPA: SIS domain-containing protein [Nitrososphaeraceae archaeon]